MKVTDWEESAIQALLVPADNKDRKQTNFDWVREESEQLNQLLDRLYQKFILHSLFVI